jgi:hypothetical protein
MQALKQINKLDKLTTDKKLIQSLYTEDEQSVIEQWIEQTPVKTSGHDDLINANLVAEIVLTMVNDELPQWAVFYESGHAMWGRKHQLKLLEKRDELLDPTFLLMINWADSGPGYSWPESYYSTYLPGYNIYVVTASQDCDDVHGFTDEAIDYFEADNPEQISEPATAIVKYWWVDQEPNQYPWVEVLNFGEIGEQEAWDLRDEVWGENFVY